MLMKVHWLHFPAWPESSATFRDSKASLLLSSTTFLAGLSFSTARWRLLLAASHGHWTSTFQESGVSFRPNSELCKSVLLGRNFLFSLIAMYASSPAAFPDSAAVFLHSASFFPYRRDGDISGLGGDFSSRRRRQFFLIRHDLHTPLRFIPAWRRLFQNLCRLFLNYCRLMHRKRNINIT